MSLIHWRNTKEKDLLRWLGFLFTRELSLNRVQPAVSRTINLATFSVLYSFICCMHNCIITWHLSHISISPYIQKADKDVHRRVGDLDREHFTEQNRLQDNCAMTNEATVKLRRSVNP
jgi:hypothetical protein